MGFFFADAEIKRSSGKDGEYRATPEVLHQLECNACPRNRDQQLRSPKMAPSGVARPSIYLLGIAPGEVEDLRGEPFVGASGQVLRRALSSTALSQVRINNTIRCRPPNNRDPSVTETECCRPSIERDIEAAAPAVIVGFGAVPLQWAVKQSSILSWRGRWLPAMIGAHRCWYVPTVHPSYILRMRNEVDRDAMERVFKADLQGVIRRVSEGVPPPPVFSQQEIYAGVETVQSYGHASLHQVVEHLQQCAVSKAPVGFDFETTQIRPYGGQVLSVALGTATGTVLAFPISHPEARWTPTQMETIHGAMRAFFAGPSAKVAHNATFELEWAGYNWGTDWFRASPWHDTMGQAYVLDERREGFKLDQLVWRYFGFKLKALSNLDRKQLAQTELLQVLRYNALDAKWTAQLFAAQESRVAEQGLEAVYQEYMRRSYTVVLTQMKGLDVDQPCAKTFQEKLECEIQTVREKIAALPVMKEFELAARHRFNPTSAPDVAFLFDRILQCPEGYSEKRVSGYSTDESVLSRIRHPLAKLVLKLRSLDKLLSYIVPILPGGKFIHPDGRIHTTLNIPFTETGRLSSDSPNIQNYPARDDSWIRQMIIPPKAHRLAKLDYGQIEARVIAMASKDQRLVDALWEKYDIHQEWAERFALEFSQLGDVKDKASMKKLRSRIKNTVVFPAFYGAHAKSISHSLAVSRDRVEILLRQFWKQFAGVRQWQEDLRTFYLAKGYVACLTGRRRRAPLTGNKIINSPVQGTASDIVVDAMNRLSERGQREGQSAYQAVMNIHDDLTFMLPCEGFEQTLETIIGDMLVTNFSFINVPLSVEVEVGDNWAELTPVGVFFSNEW